MHSLWGISFIIFTSVSKMLRLRVEWYRRLTFAIPFLTCPSLHSVFVDLFLWMHHQLLVHLPKEKENFFLKKRQSIHFNLRGPRELHFSTGVGEEIEETANLMPLALGYTSSVILIRSAQYKTYSHIQRQTRRRVDKVLILLPPKGGCLPFCFA